MTMCLAFSHLYDFRNKFCIVELKLNVSYDFNLIQKAVQANNE